MFSTAPYVHGSLAKGLRIAVRVYTETRVLINGSSNNTSPLLLSNFVLYAARHGVHKIYPRIVAAADSCMHENTDQYHLCIRVGAYSFTAIGIFLKC